jgi:hypothetical protein
VQALGRSHAVTEFIYIGLIKELDSLSVQDGGMAIHVGFTRHASDLACRHSDYWRQRNTAAIGTAAGKLQDQFEQTCGMCCHVAGHKRPFTDLPVVCQDQGLTLLPSHLIGCVFRPALCKLCKTPCSFLQGGRSVVLLPWLVTSLMPAPSPI